MLLKEKSQATKVYISPHKGTVASNFNGIAQVTHPVQQNGNEYKKYECV